MPMPGPDGQQAAGAREDVGGRGCWRGKSDDLVGRCDDAARFTRKAEKLKTVWKARRRLDFVERGCGEKKRWDKARTGIDIKQRHTFCFSPCSSVVESARSVVDQKVARACT